MENQENYVISRNERGLPIIVPLESRYAGYDLESSLTGFSTDIPLDAIVSVNVDTPSIEDRDYGDLKTIKKIKPTTVVLYVNKQGELNSAYKNGNEWTYRLTSDDMFERRKAIEDYRRKKWNGRMEETKHEDISFY